MHFEHFQMVIIKWCHLRSISVDVSVEEMIHIGMATRRFSQSLTSVCTKAPTTTGSRTAFQISIPEREAAFQRLLPSSRTRMKGTDLERTRIGVLQHYQSQVAFFFYRNHFDTRCVWLVKIMTAVSPLAHCHTVS